MSHLALVGRSQQNRSYEASGASRSRSAKLKDHYSPTIPKGFNSVSHMQYLHTQTFNVMNLNRDALAQALTGIGSKQIFKYGRLLRVGSSKELFWVITTYGPSLYLVDWFKHRIDVWSHQLASVFTWNPNTYVMSELVMNEVETLHMTQYNTKLLDADIFDWLQEPFLGIVLPCPRPATIDDWWMSNVILSNDFWTFGNVDYLRQWADQEVNTDECEIDCEETPEGNHPPHNIQRYNLAAQRNISFTKGPWRYAVYTKALKVAKARQTKHHLFRLIGGFDPVDATLSVFDTSIVEYKMGRRALTSWKNLAGSKKTWRRCERIKTANSAVVVHSWLDAQCFFKSSLWLPQAFIRSRARSGHDARKTLRSRAQCNESKKTFKSAYLHLSDQLETIVPATSLCHGQSLPGVEWTVKRDLQELDCLGLPAAYIRLTWGNGTNPIVRIDRFLSKGLVLQSRWRVVCLLRNDSHADVYVIVSIHDRSEPSIKLELHHFLAEYHGNSATYAKRRQERMHNSGCCLGRFWYGDRRMFVLLVSRPETPFRIDPKDFPALTGSASRPALQAQRTCRISNISTYAAVLRTSRGGPWLPPLHQRLKEEKARRAEEIIEGAREKKSKKQRDKRMSQRLAIRQVRAPTDEEICVTSDADE